MFDIDFSPDALQDLLWFRQAEQVTICTAIEDQLRHQPNVETRNRKRLRPGHLSEWELRVGKFMVFYDVNAEESKVIVVRVGYKERSKLFFRGQEYVP